MNRSLAYIHDLQVCQVLEHDVCLFHATHHRIPGESSAVNQLVSTLRSTWVSHTCSIHVNNLPDHAKYQTSHTQMYLNTRMFSSVLTVFEDFLNIDELDLSLHHVLLH